MTRASSLRPRTVTDLYLLLHRRVPSCADEVCDVRPLNRTQGNVTTARALQPPAAVAVTGFPPVVVPYAFDESNVPARALPTVDINMGML